MFYYKQANVLKDTSAVDQTKPSTQFMSTSG